MQQFEEAADTTPRGDDGAANYSATSCTTTMTTTTTSNIFVISVVGQNNGVVGRDNAAFENDNDDGGDSSHGAGRYGCRGNNGINYVVPDIDVNGNFSPSEMTPRNANVIIADPPDSTLRSSLPWASSCLTSARGGADAAHEAFDAEEGEDGEEGEREGEGEEEREGEGEGEGEGEREGDVREAGEWGLLYEEEAFDGEETVSVSIPSAYRTATSRTALLPVTTRTTTITTTLMDRGRRIVDNTNDEILLDICHLYRESPYGDVSSAPITTIPSSASPFSPSSSLLLLSSSSSFSLPSSQSLFTDV